MFSRFYSGSEYKHLSSNHFSQYQTNIDIPLTTGSQPNILQVVYLGLHHFSIGYLPIYNQSTRTREFQVSLKHKLSYLKDVSEVQIALQALNKKRDEIKEQLFKLTRKIEY